MAKRSLLNMVQGILSAMDSDDVNSIGDTEEAQQVAKIIEDVYYDLADEHDFAHTKDLFVLEGSGDSSKPTHMRLPQDVSKIEWIKYDKRGTLTENKNYEEVHRMEPIDFVEMCMNRPDTDTTNYVLVPYKTNINLTIYKKNPPTYWTSFDDEFIVFDSYSSSIEDTLQSAKVMCYGTIRPSFTSMSDSFIPDLPENLFPLLYNEAMSRATNLWKQTVFPKIEQSASRSRVRAQRNKWRQTVVHEGVDYGRK